jgi:hypothetical protein
LNLSKEEREDEPIPQVVNLDVVRVLSIEQILVSVSSLLLLHHGGLGRDVSRKLEGDGSCKPGKRGR